MSAPGVRGCVYLLKDFQLKLGVGLNIIEDLADITLCSQEEYARYPLVNLSDSDLNYN